MPMSDEEQRDIFARARTLILVDFHQEFQHLYSYAITVLELAPDQANNEIRNALNHIARAMCADSVESANENLRQSKGHIDRAKRDCIKLANIHLHEQIKSDLLNIEAVEGAVPFSIKQRLSTLEHRGAAARRAEANGDPDVVDSLADVFADLKGFRDDIHQQYAVPNKIVAQWKRFLRRAGRHCGGFVLGVIAAVAGGAVLMLLLHHQFWSFFSRHYPRIAASVELDQPFLVAAEIALDAFDQHGNSASL
jgi:hypothetical protein